MSALATKFHEKSTALVTSASLMLVALLASNPALADSFDDYKKQNGGDKSLFNQDGSGPAENFAKGGVNILKWFGLLFGIVVVMIGLFMLKKASTAGSQVTAGQAWMVIFVGGMFTIVATIAMVIGRTVEGAAGVK